MIVYHGSRHRFKKLRIGKSLVDKRSTIDNEGYGIYFSTDIHVAQSYGRYIYTLEINDNYFKDFRNIHTCEKYMKDLCEYILSKTNIDITQYINTNEISNRMRFGGMMIANTGKEIALILDNTETFYMNISNAKRKRLHQILRNYDKKQLNAYMFTYHISNIGVIKNINENVVKIIKRKTQY